MKIKNIYWIAGLLEGEGCFYLSGTTPSISIQMTDQDTIEKFGDLTKCANGLYITRDSRENRQVTYRLQFGGSLALQWMFTLYSLMSLRRKAKIREILQVVMNKPAHGTGLWSDPKKSLIRSFRKLGFTLEEATQKVNSMLPVNS